MSVLIGDVRDWRGQGEDLMEVRHRQKLGFAGGKPFACRRALALRAVPVHTTVIGDGHVAAGAVLASRDMAAERCRAAVLDGTHHFELAEAHMAAIGSAPCSPVAAEDIRNLQRRAGHRSLRLKRPSCLACPAWAASAGPAGLSPCAACWWQPGHSARSCRASHVQAALG